MEYTIKANEAFKSIEINFEGKPSEAVRDALKALRFRWHGVKKIWYGYTTEETAKNAIENAEKGNTIPKAKKAEKVAEKVNKYGVKVGDVFCMSWGYEQTNVDFFQVIKLVGEASVMIRDVSPDYRTESGGFMCEDRVYNITPEPMRKSHSSVFVDDNEKGKLKRVCKSGDTIYLNMTSYANAYKIPFGERKEYVSWYA